MRAPTTLALLAGAALSLDTVACNELATCHEAVSTTTMTGELHGVESAQSARARAHYPDAGPLRRDSEISTTGQLDATSCLIGVERCTVSIYHAFSDVGLWDFVIKMRSPKDTGLVALEDLDATVCQSPYIPGDDGGIGTSTDDCTSLHGTLDVHAIDSECNSTTAPCTGLDAQLHVDPTEGDGPSLSGDTHLFTDQHLVETECSSNGCGGGWMGGPGNL